MGRVCSKPRSTIQALCFTGVVSYVMPRRRSHMTHVTGRGQRQQRWAAFVANVYICPLAGKQESLFRKSVLFDPFTRFKAKLEDA